MAFEQSGLAPAAYRALSGFDAFLFASSILESGEQRLAVHGTPAEKQAYAMAVYCRELLGRSHPALGRSGPVCPFINRAIACRHLLITSHNGQKDQPINMQRALLDLKKAFLLHSGRMDKEDRIFHAVVVTFPGVSSEDAPRLVDQVQHRLKPDFVKSGLMIGEFYPECAASGLHNTEFRPLRSPVPAIAVRHMTLQDAPFIFEDDRFRASYERRFGRAGIDRIKALLGRCETKPVPQAQLSGVQSA